MTNTATATDQDRPSQAAPLRTLLDANGWNPDEGWDDEDTKVYSPSGPPTLQALLTYRLVSLRDDVMVTFTWKRLRSGGPWDLDEASMAVPEDGYNDECFWTTTGRWLDLDLDSLDAVLTMTVAEVRKHLVDEYGWYWQ